MASPTNTVTSCLAWIGVGFGSFLSVRVPSTLYMVDREAVSDGDLVPVDSQKLPVSRLSHARVLPEPRVFVCVPPFSDKLQHHTGVPGTLVRPGALGIQAHTRAWRGVHAVSL